MGKHLRDESTPGNFNVRSSHPGCTWNIFHVLKYNRWRNIKRRLPHKKRNGGKTAAEDGNPDSCVFDEKTPEEHHVGGKNKMVPHSSAGTKSSVRARLIALITYEMSRRKGRHHRNSACPAKSSHLIRSDSFHRPELPDKDPKTETKVEDSSPNVLDPSTGKNPPDYTVPLKSPTESASEKCVIIGDVDDNRVNENKKEQISNGVICQDELSGSKQTELTRAEEHSRQSSLDKSNDQMLEAQEVINMNNELIDILQDPSCPLSQQIYSEKEFSAKMERNKSGSFSFHESFDQGPDKSELNPEVGSHSQKSVEPELTEDICKQSAPSTPAAHRSSGLKVNESIPEVINLSALPKPNHENRMVIKRFKDLKEKIKDAMKDSKKEKRITRDAILDKIPRKQGFSKDLKEDVFDHVKDLKVNRDSPTDSSDNSVSTDEKRREGFKRTSSVDKSMERYCHLYAVSFNRESKENPCEKSESRTDEEASLPSSSEQKYLGRISSLPELGFSFCTSEGSPDVGGTVSVGNFDEKETTERLSALETPSQLGSTIKSHVQENDSETNSVNEDRQEGSTIVENGEALMPGDISLIEQDGEHVSKSTTKLVESSLLSVDELVESSLLSVDDSDTRDESTGSAEFNMTEDAELTPKHLPNELANLQHQPTDEMAEEPENELTLDAPKVEISTNLMHSDFLRAQVDAEDKAKFDYVKEVLELSGFSGTESLGAWHSDNQPLDTAMCQEMEGCVLLDPDCSGNDEDGTCVYLVLFDLINELLLEIWESSYAYYPKPLSGLSHIHPMPVGYYVLEEVWARVNWYLSSVPGSDLSLDYVVGRDLDKNDGWMNLQFDMECVGFELEDMIFEDLIEEVMRT